VSITGFPDDPPMRVGAEQAYHSASLHAAVGTLLALAQRDADGEGRRRGRDAGRAGNGDPANRELQLYTMLGIVRSALVTNRASELLRRNAPPVSSIFPCKDGWIVYTTPPNPPHY
jgi:crotonobetainyl-CoA:carnitine CoA-transferase CaiB-like acyl-CoA transferase